jgi:hypothetical protein
MPKTIVPAELTTESRRRCKVEPIFILFAPISKSWTAELLKR